MGRYEWDKTNHVLIPIVGGTLSIASTQQMLADIETDPTSCANAYNVGANLIFADQLYEVISAISIGDALIAYEHDPANANIKLAMNYSTQLANKQNALTFDTTPTSGSNNPVTSGGVYDYINTMITQALAASY